MPAATNYSFWIICSVSITVGRIMSEPTLPQSFQRQGLRSYITSYYEITHDAELMRGITKKTATKGPITNPEGRRAPRVIEPWNPAERDRHRAVIDAVVAGLGDEALFPCKQHVRHVGEDLVRLDSENALLLFDADTLHKPAARIMREVLASDNTRAAVTRALHSRKELARGLISFPTHRNRVSNTSGVKRKRGSDLRFLRPGPADVFCSFTYGLPADIGGADDTHDTTALRDPDGLDAVDSITVADDTGPNSGRVGTILLFIKEAKAPHKLTAGMIDMAVASGKTLRPAEIMDHGFTVSSPGLQLSVDESEYWFAAVCAQLYTNMIDEGVRYGVISTGIYYIFMAIDPDNPATIRYNVCRTEDGIPTSPLLCLVSLALLAMHHGELPETAELDVIRRGAGLHWATAQELPGSSPAVESQPTNSFVDTPGDQNSTSPMSSGSHNHAPGQVADVQDRYTTAPSGYPSPPQHPRSNSKRARGEEEEQANKKPRLDAVTRTAHRVAHSTVDHHEASTQTPVSPVVSPRLPPNTTPTSARSHRYCSVACLQALQDINAPEAACPNQVEHARAGRLTTEQLCKRLVAQFKDPSTRCYGYEKFNILNILRDCNDTLIVKVCLLSHGYTFIAKTNPPKNRTSMYREVYVYDRLRHLQGSCVPVCLGAVELPEDVAVWHYVPYTGLLLLSWAGYDVGSWGRLGFGLSEMSSAMRSLDRNFSDTLSKTALEALSKIHKAGVIHGDVALRNVMLHDIVRRGQEFHLSLQFIDFGCSRTRSDYRRRARHCQKRAAGDGKRAEKARATMAYWASSEGGGLTDPDGVGNADFSRDCEKELKICKRAVKWVEDDISEVLG
ncbi:hypothetical protein FJTKL_11677 [Diaporthe vaccinii]|uniref:non-specific serine/threonine protein kinase n=1 Tax=Diaporthe vaccinii TaxID=105482 RepID=A0ABR4EFR2_9PEZI